MSISALTLDNFSNKSFFEQIKGVSDNINSGISALSETINNTIDDKVKEINDFVGETKSSFVRFKNDVFYNKDKDKLGIVANTVFQTGLGALTFLGGLATTLAGGTVTIGSYGGLSGIGVPATAVGITGMTYGASAIASGVLDFSNMLKGNWNQVGKSNVLENGFKAVLGEKAGRATYYLTDMIVTSSSILKSLKLLKITNARYAKSVPLPFAMHAVPYIKRSQLTSEIVRDSIILINDGYSWANETIEKEVIEDDMKRNSEYSETNPKNIFLKHDSTFIHNKNAGATLEGIKMFDGDKKIYDLDSRDNMIAGTNHILKPLYGDSTFIYNENAGATLEDIKTSDSDKKIYDFDSKDNMRTGANPIIKSLNTDSTTFYNGNKSKLDTNETVTTLEKNKAILDEYGFNSLFSKNIDRFKRFIISQ